MFQYLEEITLNSPNRNIIDFWNFSLETFVKISNFHYLTNNICSLTMKQISLKVVDNLKCVMPTAT